jgi:subtilisin family serine protease
MTDTIDGGFLAFQSETATAIHGAIAAWEANPGPNLVINLSFAWLADFGGRDIDAVNAPPGVDAVYKALQRASCRGALIIAAAGNRNYEVCGDDEDQEMLPAQWEEIPAPSPAMCPSVGVPTLQAVTFANPYSPLLHSVGGRGLDGERLALGRASGRPRLAGLAEQVLGPDTSLTPRVGTSFSAAGASGVAAQVWSYRPDLDSSEVADILWQSGRSAAERVNKFEASWFGVQWMTGVG